MEKPLVKVAFTPTNAVLIDLIASCSTCGRIPSPYHFVCSDDHIICLECVDFKSQICGARLYPKFQNRCGKPFRFQGCQVFSEMCKNGRMFCTFGECRGYFLIRELGAHIRSCLDRPTVPCLYLYPDCEFEEKFSSRTIVSHLIRNHDIPIPLVKLDSKTGKKRCFLPKYCFTINSPTFVPFLLKCKDKIFICVVDKKEIGFDKFISTISVYITGYKLPIRNHYRHPWRPTVERFYFGELTFRLDKAPGFSKTWKGEIPTILDRSFDKISNLLVIPLTEEVRKRGLFLDVTIKHWTRKEEEDVSGIGNQPYMFMENKRNQNLKINENA